MKKKVFITTILAALMMAVMSITAFASPPIVLDGQLVDVDAIIVDGRTLIPVGAIIELLGGNAEWDGEARQVTINQGSVHMLLTIDSDVAVVNGYDYGLDVPAQIINDRTMVPLGFVSSFLGVQTDFRDGTVYLYTGIIEIDFAQLDSLFYVMAISEFIESFQDMADFLIFLVDIVEYIETEDELLEWIDYFEAIKETTEEAMHQLTGTALLAPVEFMVPQFAIASAVAKIYETIVEFDHALATYIRRGNEDVFSAGIENFIENIMEAHALWSDALRIFSETVKETLVF